MAMDQLSLVIQGMHCGGCVRRVTGALEKVAGVKIGSVEVGSAQVEYDPAQCDAPAIRAAIEKLGFKVAPDSR